MTVLSRIAGLPARYVEGYAANPDANGIAEVRRMIKELARDGRRTILISSHILEELSKTAHVFGVLKDGVMTAEITEAELASSSVGYIRFMLDDIAAAKEVLEKMGIYAYQQKGDHLLLVMEQIHRSGDMIREFVLNGIHVSGCETVHESLEDFYIGHTREG